MASDNTGYSYQRSQQHQDAVNSYGTAREDYTQQRWPDYGVPSQHQYAHSTQHVAGLTMRNASTGSRDIDVVVGVSSGNQARTPTASSVPGRSSSGFSGEGYDHYTATTTATHVQHYQSQAPTITAVGSQGGSRTVTANSRQDSGNTAFAGYNQFPMTSHIQSYQQSQPAGTTVDMPQQYRTSGNTPQQQQPAEYFDYTPSTTTAQNYTPIYQTTDSIRQSTQATSAPIYTSPMHQTTNSTPSSHEATSAQGYDGMYQKANPQQQRRRQQQTVQSQIPRTVTPVQQPTTQPREPQKSKFQAVNRLQQQYSVPPAHVQHTQYENFAPTITHRTPTPSSISASEASYSSAVSYQAVPSQPQTQLQTHVTLPQPRQPLVATSQNPPQLLHQAPSTQSMPPQQPTPAPVPTHPMKQHKPKPHPKKTVQQQNDGGLRVGTWDAPATAPPKPKVLQEPSMPVMYRQALCNVGGAGNVGDVKSLVEEVPTPRIMDVGMMEASQSWNAPTTAAPRVVGTFRAVNQQATPPPPQIQNMQRVLSAQRLQNGSPQPQQAVTSQGKQDWQARAPQYHPQQPQKQYVPEQRPESQHQPQQQQHQPKPQHIEAQTQSYQAPSQPTQPQYQIPAPTLSQHALQDTPPPQPQPKHDSPQHPQSRAPSEPRPALPLNKDLMEQQMKVMVERMRYYQAADPVTFQQVWDNVKNGATGGAITNGSAGGANNDGTIMARDGSIGRAGGGGRSNGVERIAIMNVPMTAPQTMSEATGTSGSQPQHSQQPAQIQQVSQSVAPAQPVSAPVPVRIPPSQTADAPTSNGLAPPQENGLNVKTARAVSKYLIKTSGHCLPEEVTLELLNRIKSFPVLCDKLEAMGYQFHRGNFSRFLLAEVDGEEQEAATAAGEVDVDMGVDDGESRVLGEVEGDQEQIMRELNETRNIAPPSLEPVPEPARAPAEPTVSSPHPEQPVERRQGTPRKYTVAANEFQTASGSDTDISVAPKTPMVATATAVNSLPTPMSVVPTALSSLSIDQPVPTAPFYNGVFQQSPPSPEDVSPSPKPDYVLRQPNILSHPTPQSVKVTQATPTTHAGGMTQFVIPSQVYRPPTPPRLIIDLESPSPPQIPTEEVAVDMEMMGMHNVERGSPKSLIVKLRLDSKEPSNSNVLGASSTAPQYSKGVTIDLTSSATPEPQTNRVPQIPATAPQLGEIPGQRWCEWQYLGGRVPPVLIPIPQSAPAKQNVVSNPVMEEPLWKPVARKNELVKLLYDPATIARDIMIATGRSPNVVRPLNAHLDTLQSNMGRMKLAGVDADLETFRWDIVDPNPIGYDDAGDIDGMADDEDESGGGGGLGFAIARAPVVSRNLTVMKGMGVVASPTPVGRVSGSARGSVLRDSVKDFENSGQGITTVLDPSNRNDSGSRAPRRQSATNDGRGNGNSSSSGGGSWGGFAVPAPRSNPRSGSGLRNVSAPNIPSRNFEVVIRSPSVSSIDQGRAEPPSAKNLKRKLNDSDKERGSPAAKKTTGQQTPASRVGKKGKGKNKDELRPSGFKVFKCRWRHCSAELHNFETLHRHVIKAHCKLADFGGYLCKWEGCLKSPSKEMKAAAVARRDRGGPSTLKYTWDFDNAEKWEKHVVELHLDGVRNELGVGPSVGPYDREAVGSDVDYLSDNQGRRITPIARPAPSGYVFLPPPGYISTSGPNRYIARVRALGAGMEGNESADLRENDNGEGILLAVRRIVPAEDGALEVLGVSASASGSTSEGTKEKSKEKSKEDGDDGETQMPSGAGAFTVHDEE